MLGQPVILALGGPNPRTTGWHAGMTPFRRVAVGTIVKTAYESSVPVWPDGSYPHRIGISFHAVGDAISLSDVGARTGRQSGIPALPRVLVRDQHRLANPTIRRNRRWPGWEIPRWPLLRSGIGIPRRGDIDSIPVDYEFDREISATVRVEARYFRQQLFGDAETGGLAPAPNDAVLVNPRPRPPLAPRRVAPPFPGGADPVLSAAPVPLAPPPRAALLARFAPRAPLSPLQRVSAEGLEPRTTGAAPRGRRSTDS